LLPDGEGLLKSALLSLGKVYPPADVFDDLGVNVAHYLLPVRVMEA
jgi:hypothetical protein